MLEFSPVKLSTVYKKYINLKMFIIYVSNFKFVNEILNIFYLILKRFLLITISVKLMFFFLIFKFFIII